MMKIQMEGRDIEFDECSPIDISIPLNFNGPQPNAYGVEPAAAKPCVTGDLVGDTRLGGSCNFEQYTFIPHCNGTHTECVGHITHERISMLDCLRDVFIPAVLISVSPESASETGDLVITRESIEAASKSVPGAVVTGDLLMDSGSGIQPPATAGGSDSALIIRTLPNADSKLTREYDDVIPPYFSTEAMAYIVEIGVKHLLVDLPSIDRIHDEGRLSNHRIFWNVEPGSFETNANTRLHSTITELIYVPDEVMDREYLLNLQIAPFASDASTSRPILFRII